MKSSLLTEITSEITTVLLEFQMPGGKIVSSLSPMIFPIPSELDKIHRRRSTIANAPPVLMIAALPTKNPVGYVEPNYD
jgi:hypothetical protein